VILIAVGAQFALNRGCRPPIERSIVQGDQVDAFHDHVYFARDVDSDLQVFDGFLCSEIESRL